MTRIDTGLSKTNESRLRRAKRLLQMVAATAPNPVGQEDKHGRYVRWTEVYGLTVERQVNRMILKIDELLHTEDDLSDDE